MVKADIYIKENDHSDQYFFYTSVYGETQEEVDEKIEELIVPEYYEDCLKEV
jgi:hypothetical protein